MYNDEIHEDFRSSPKKNLPLKVAAYIRVSTNRDDQKNSYETQERYFHQLLRENPRWIFAGIYSDYGISGTSRKKRTGFKRILRHCTEHKIDRIICKSISRFARNTLDFMTALNTLRESGTTIYFEKEGLDTSDSASHFILATLAAIAQEESRSISANIRWGNEKRFLRGDVPNQAIYGYRYTGEYTVSKSGYCCKTVEIVKEEAAVVRWIFEQNLRGATCGQIARNLNFRKIPGRPSFYNQKRQRQAAKGQLRQDIDEGWTAGQIRLILENERYCGDVRIQKTYTENYLTHRIQKNRGERTQYWAKDHHPAIINRKLFEKTRKVRKTNTATKVSVRSSPAAYAFSQTLICCCCGRFYHVRNTHRNPIWFCPSTARNNGKILCRSKKVYEKQLIRMFRQAIRERFSLIDPSRPGQSDHSYFEKARLFLPELRALLQSAQNMDFAERDRAFLQRRIRNTPENAVQEKKHLTEQLKYMEKYWEELEAGYTCRAQAILWLETLPEGLEGLTAFLEQITDRYVKALVLSITIHDPLHYTIHWFDDTQTQVEMSSNVKDHRYKNACPNSVCRL